MLRELTLNKRNIRDYLCISNPKLILIAKEPLLNDKDEIFCSEQGAKYLSFCFNSKFLPMNTIITYIKSDNSGQFCKSILFEILEKYFKESRLDLSQIRLGFIGEDTYDTFLQDYKAACPMPTNKEIYLNETYKSIKFTDTRLDSKNNYYMKYIILPSIDNPSNLITEKLNSFKTLDDEEFIAYSSWQETVDYLKKLSEYIDSDTLKAIYYDIDHTGTDMTAKNVLSINIADHLTGKTIYFNPIRSEKPKTKEETDTLFNEYKEFLKKVLTSVSVYTTNSEWLDKCSYKNEIKFCKEEEYLALLKGHVLDRPSFKIFGNENGNKSEWYEKWRKTTFRILVNEKKITKTDAIREGYSDLEKYEWIYDIEVFKKDWLFVAKSLDGKSKVICWNDPFSLAKWIKNKILIGFNNAAYDDVVIRHAMAYPYIKNKALTPKVFSDKLIIDEEKPKFPEFNSDSDRNKIPNFLSWDISFHMPFDIRRNSLKKLTMSVLNKKNYDSEVSFDIDRPLTEKERIDVEKYCEMDVDNTRNLYLPDQNNPKRDFARDSYDIRWNLIIEYKMKAKTLINKSSSFAGKVLCGEDAKPNLKNTYKDINDDKVYYSIPDLALKELAGTPVLNFYLANQHNPDYIHEKFEYYMGGNDESHKYQFGFGGLHQALINYNGTNLCNFDVASLYPSLLIQYNLGSRGMENQDAYKEVYNTRIEAKHSGKKLLNLGLKLVLNGAIGAMLSEFNPLFDTWSNSSICVHGQLLVFILAKRLFEAGFNIVQTNTDGIMVEKRDDIDFMPICKQWEEETRLVLEYDDILIVRQLNVNNYFALFADQHAKSKGVFLSNEKFGIAVSKILCNIATNKPLLEGCQPRDFVIFKKHSIGEIYDAKTNTKLEGRSLAFVIGKADDPRTQAYYSRSRNEREVVKKDDKGKTILDENGNQQTEVIHSISKISGFTDHMLLVDDINALTMDEINTQMYISLAKNLLGEVETFGPYYDINFIKSDEPAYLQALNPLKNNTDEYPTKAGVVCQNFLFECDYLSKEEQEELIEPIKQYTYRIVWSGSRSYHIVVRINKPVTSIQYKKLWYYLQYKLGLDGADIQSCLPNKYTRVPDQINPKTGNLQELYCENKYVFDLDEILENMPKIESEIKQPTQYKGKVDIKALERHIKRQDWSEGNRFAACQKLSPILISQVDMDELIKMIPIKLEKDHLHCIRAKYYYYEKYKHLYNNEQDDESESC